MSSSLMLFTGNANRPLAEKIAKFLEKELADATVTRFSEGEIFVKINTDVRGRDVFVIQPTCPPPNENLMELLIMMDALKRASASRITAVIPYFGYARQDRKDQPRVPITAKLVADLITAAGAHRVLTMDLHAGQIQGFFNIPVDHLLAASVMTDYIKKMKFEKELSIVSPDVGNIKMARALARKIGCSFGVVDKRRVSDKEAEVMNIIGEVKDKDVVLVDDIVATAGSLTEAAKALKIHGANNIYAVVSHAVLSGPAYERLNKSPIKTMFITDSIPVEPKNKKIRIVSIAGLFGEAIRRIHHNESVSSLFDDTGR
jgi:ribose-phosphate pyrophosphokinase